MYKLLILLASYLFSFSILAAEKPSAPKPNKVKSAELSAEQRENMAKHHEQMAACLRSDKPIDVCHEEHRKACGADKGCLGMGHNMGHDMGPGMMQKPVQ
ncbi:MAG: hypothetical protein NTX25_12305 [Proteobacteria bacterium]|nr:hypothetical protein [Pseudomonadota bacterium]